MKIQWKYKNDLEIFETKGQESTPYLSFRALDDLGMVKNGFSTAWAEPAAASLQP